MMSRNVFDCSIRDLWLVRAIYDGTWVSELLTSAVAAYTV